MLITTSNQAANADEQMSRERMSPKIPITELSGAVMSVLITKRELQRVRATGAAHLSQHICPSSITLPKTWMGARQLASKMRRILGEGRTNLISLEFSRKSREHYLLISSYNKALVFYHQKIALVRLFRDSR